MDKPVIEFKSYRISKIDYQLFNKESDIELESLNSDGRLKVSIGINEDDTEAQIELEITFYDESINRSINVAIIGRFLINDPDNADEHLAVNGTAILYPYLRSVISFVTSLDNENAIILPTINTSDIPNNKQPD